jgi:hypothetical protein
MGEKLHFSSERKYTPTVFEKDVTIRTFVPTRDKC